MVGNGGRFMVICQNDFLFKKNWTCDEYATLLGDNELVDQLKMLLLLDRMSTITYYIRYKLFFQLLQ